MPSAGPYPQQAAQSKRDFADSRPDEVNLDGQTISGFKVKKKLGAGGMGAVLLATQVALDRDVALKILPGKFAQNPDFLARFTREALSAAQINHHNVIQVYDVGNDGDIHFIAMELVKGDNLGGMTRKGGKLSIDDATGYVLQAARGLLYAHQCGIIHRDIKPDNIMVNEHGVVKIADLGLAKMTGRAEKAAGLDFGGEDELKAQAYSDLTSADIAMGTPAYMAPEQGRDASKADHRADQYSLGCTLYYLIAGKTPFSGKTTFELISKHATEPLIPIDIIVKNVPKELSLIIEKMLAKDPADRYGSLKEVIEALEAYLGVESSKGPYTPREQHVAVLEREQKGYYAAGSIGLRRWTKVGFFGGLVALLIGLSVARLFFPAAAVLGLLVLTPLFHFVLNGVLQKTHLFRRSRAVFFGMSLKGWSSTVLSSVAALLVLYALGLLVPWLIVAVFAIGCAAGYEFAVLRKLRAERVPMLDAMQEMLKSLRVKGVSEEALQDFVSRFSSEHWEEFFEDLFGYEDMILMRAKWAAKDKVKPRKKFATWRDSLSRWLDEVETSRKKIREQKQLAKTEAARLKAKGMTAEQAQVEGDKMANETMAAGLLQKTAIIAVGPSKAELAKVDLELAAMRRGAYRTKFWWGHLAMRLVLGLLFIAGALTTLNLAFMAPIEGILKPIFIWGFKGIAAKPIVYSLSILLVGTLLLLSAASQRFFFPLLILLGSIMAVFAGPLCALVGNQAVTPLMMMLLGVVIAIGAFALMVMARIGGGKF